MEVMEKVMKVFNISDYQISTLMNNLRFVILDYPKLQMENNISKLLLSDVLTARQIGYQKASGTYISIDKLDMIGTHILICDISNIYVPKVIAGLRLSYSDRCLKHSIELPMDVNIKFASQDAQKVYKEFKNSNKLIVESNALFVDMDYAYSKTKVDLSQILVTSMLSFIMRLGYSNLITATNEKFKASRWVDFGSYSDGHYFFHPSMPDQHKIILVDKFYYKIINKRFESLNQQLTRSFDVLPDEIKLKLKPFDKIKEEIDNMETIKAA